MYYVSQSDATRYLALVMFCADVLGFYILGYGSIVDWMSYN